MIANLPVYYLSLFKAPVQVIENIEKLMRKFLWMGSKEGNGIHWVSWSVVTKPKRFGGLGIAKLSEVNAALLVKWAWRFKIDNKGLWKKSILSIHGGRNKWSFLPINKTLPGAWKAIVSLLNSVRFDGRSIDQLISCDLGDGNSINFWKDVWVGDTPLWRRWPNLFKTETEKNASVSNRLKLENGIVRIVGDWMQGAVTVAGISEVQDAVYLLSKVILGTGRDRWVWDNNRRKNCSVAEVKNALRKNTYVQPNQKMRWETWVPIKVNILVWRIGMERVPTCSELIKRGVQLPANTCSLCSSEVETVSHAFVTFRFVFEVWCKVWNWCRIQFAYNSSMEGMFDALDSFHLSARGKKIVRCIIMVTCWAVWKERNKAVFEKSTPKVAEVIATVKSLSFIWIRYRSNCNRLDLEWLG